MKNLRCRNKMHGILSDEFVEVKCKSRRCGARPGVVVLHRFSLGDGELLETLRFKDPEEVKSIDSPGVRTAIRDAGHQGGSDDRRRDLRRTG